MLSNGLIMEETLEGTTRWLHRIWERKQLNLIQKRDQGTSRYAVDSDFVFSTRFKSKHLNESTYLQTKKHIKLAQICDNL